MAFSLGSIFKQGRVSPPRAAKPFFDGLNPSDDFSITGGAISQIDENGLLRPSYINQYTIGGGRWAKTVSEGAKLGPELFTGDLTTGAGVTVTGTDATHIVTFGTSGMRYQSDTRSPILNVTLQMQAGLSVGKRYLATITTSQHISGQLKNDTFGSAAINIAQTGTTVVESVCVVGNTFALYRNSADVDVTIQSASIREVIPQWVTTDIYGNDIQPAKIIRTAKGLLKEHYEVFADDIDDASEYAIGDQVLVQTVYGPMWLECIGISEDSEYFAQFNGFDYSDIFTFTGGPVTCMDMNNVLQSGYADVPSIEGGRYDWLGWHDWEADLTSVYADDDDFVGVVYDTATDTWERLGSAKGMAVGQLPSGIMEHQVLNKLRRVVLADDGTVYKGVSWDDFTKHADGTDVALDGTNGQIMMEYLPAYVMFLVDGTKYITLLSEQPLPGFVKHPVFWDSDAVYLGAYEASLVPGQTKLSSIARDPRDGTSPVWPVTTRTGDWGHPSLTMEAIDTLAEARGAGWQQADFMTRHWERLLMLVAFAGWNFQSMVGNGRTGLSGGDWLNDSYVGRCGLGDATGGYHSAVQAGGTDGYLTDYSQVLGVENTYGNVWDRVASLVNDHAVYYKTKPPYDYSSVTGWSRLVDALGDGITLPDTNGYAGVPHSGLGLVLPADVTGSSSTKMTDYLYQAAGLRVFRVGGFAYSGPGAGPFDWVADSAASYAHAGIGGRLCFKGGA